MKALHISVPKNGGTYIAHNIVPAFAHGKIYIVDEDKIKLGDLLADPEARIRDYDFIAGHIPFKLLSKYAHQFDFIISSYRHPWPRAWSAFRFITRHQTEWKHLAPSSADDVKQKFEQFIDQYFIANRFTRNNQCGYIGEANLPQSALENIEKFNIQMVCCENMQADLAKALAKIGVTKIIESSINESKRNDWDLAEGDHPAVDAKIRHWFDGDYKLYQALRARAALS
jgi:hypothetical protein